MSGPTQQAPTSYQPQNSPGQDAAFQQGSGQLLSAGQNLYGSVAPQYGQISSNVANNPYYNTALAAASSAATTGIGQVAPQQFAGANTDTGIAQLSAGSIPGMVNAATAGGVQGYGAAMTGGVQGYNQAQSMMANPALATGLGAAPGVLSTGLGNANTSWGQSQDALAATQGYNANLMGSAGQTLNTAYDPQQALYNRSYQQMQEQANAINAQNGVAGSPFGAGLSAQDSGNFNIDWQNAQLQRQIAALGAYGTAAGTATGDVNSTLGQGASDYTNLSTGAVNNYTGLTSNATNNFTNLLGAGSSALNSGISTGTAALNNGINTGVGALTGLGSQAINANAGASTLGTQGLSTLMQSGQAANSTYLAQQQAQLDALNAQVSGTNSALSPTQAATGDANTYLNTGISAASQAGQAAQTNNASAAAGMAGIGSLISTGLGVAAMFATGGAAAPALAGTGLIGLF